ncbi:unnamed protein product [Chrysoparadoxa australica]
MLPCLDLMDRLGPEPLYPTVQGQAEEEWPNLGDTAMGEPDWEDWNPSESSFIHHMVAGSIAGIAEHTVIFPIDTIKTHIQCARSCPERVAGRRVFNMVVGEGPLRLWRGVGTMFIGCVPAHALYFSSLEQCKAQLGVNQPGHHPFGAAVAGGVATVFHDAIMTPMDVIKQRLQLGYYKGMTDCAKLIYRTEGITAFYRSFPTTLVMNMPYGAVMVAANESLKRMLRPHGDYDTSTYMLAGCGAGAAAAAATTPLDVVKTRLQTQALAHLSHQYHPKRNPLGLGIVMKDLTPAPAMGLHSASTAGHCVRVGCLEKPAVPLQYRGLMDACRQIMAAERIGGFFRGLLPRLMVHAPSVAISWTTYETAKVCHITVTTAT